jgi:hypothetical protein
VSSIDDLAAIVRAGLDQDQRDAEEDRLRQCPTCHRPAGEPGKMLAGVRYECGHYFEWNHLFDLREREQQTTTRALARVNGLRALLDEALGWEHGRSYSGEGCHFDPCLCGRDERVLAVLTRLAQPYQETT